MCHQGRGSACCRGAGACADRRPADEAGWVVQDKKALNLFAAQGVACREVTMASGHCRAVPGHPDDDWFTPLGRQALVLLRRAARRRRRRHRMHRAADHPRRSCARSPRPRSAVSLLAAFWVCIVANCSDHRGGHSRQCWYSWGGAEPESWRRFDRCKASERTPVPGGDE